MTKWVALLLGLVLILRFTAVYDSLKTNIAAYLTNYGISYPQLPYEQRLEMFKSASQIDSSLFNALAAREQTALQTAASYLHHDDQYKAFVPGAQLLHNPDFTEGTIGWTQYNSDWNFSSQGVPVDDVTVVTFARQGEGHASLSQTLQLEADACYLFAIKSSVERQDDTLTFWFYLETYGDDGKPIGQSLVKASGSQIWESRFEPFCLPRATNSMIKVTVAPVNLYGDASTMLGSARLYRLLEGRD